MKKKNFIILSITSVIVSFVLNLINSGFNSIIQWTSNLLLSLSASFFIAFYFSWRDEKNKKQEELIKEMFAVRDYIYKVMSILLHIASNDSSDVEINRHEIIYIARAIPLFKYLPKVDLNLVKDLDKWAEKVENINIEYEEIIKCIDESNCFLERLGRLNDQIKQELKKVI